MAVDWTSGLRCGAHSTSITWAKALKMDGMEVAREGGGRGRGGEVGPGERVEEEWLSAFDGPPTWWQGDQHIGVVEDNGWADYGVPGGDLLALTRYRVHL